MPLATPAQTMPTRAAIHDLLSFLGAGVDVSRHDGRHDKAEAYSALKSTVEALIACSSDLSKVTRVAVITDRDGLVQSDLASTGAGARLELRDEGRTLAVIPRHGAGGIR